jgi:hypothetical protein
MAAAAAMDARAEAVAATEAETMGAAAAAALTGFSDLLSLLFPSSH